MGEDLRARLRRLRREGAQEAPSSPEPIQPASLADGACDPARREESESSSRPVEARDSAGAEDHEAARDRVAPSAPAAGAVAARSAFERLKRRKQISRHFGNHTIAAIRTVERDHCYARSRAAKQDGFVRHRQSLGASKHSGYRKRI